MDLVTQIDGQIAVVSQQLADLQAIKAAQDAARAADSLAVRNLAVGIHHNLCTKTHADTNPNDDPLVCTWYGAADADNAAIADWTEQQHQSWLLITRTAIAVARGNGFTVTEPAT